MGKLIKSIVAGICVLSMATWGVPAWGDLIDSENIPVSVTISPSGTGDITVTLIDIASGSTASSLSFDTSSVSLSSPWVASNEYLRVVYSSTYNATWGLRIVTDNEDLEGDSDDDIDRIAACPDASGNDLYSGLVVLDEADPSQRAPWAWQVNVDPLSGFPTVPIVSIEPDTTRGGSVVVDNDGDADGDGSADDDSPDTVGPWNAAWAYIGDKNDETYNGVDSSGNDVILEDGDGDGYVDDPIYAMVLVGPSGGGSSTLAQHPQKSDAAGDGDIDIYLTARFANTNWGTSSTDEPFAFVLPSNTYSASLYLELIYE